MARSTDPFTPCTKASIRARAGANGTNKARWLVGYPTHRIDFDVAASEARLPSTPVTLSDTTLVGCRPVAPDESGTADCREVRVDAGGTRTATRGLAWPRADRKYKPRFRNTSE